MFNYFQSVFCFWLQRVEMGLTLSDRTEKKRKFSEPLPVSALRWGNHVWQKDVDLVRLKTCLCGILNMFWWGGVMSDGQWQLRLSSGTSEKPLFLFLTCSHSTYLILSFILISLLCPCSFNSSSHVPFVLWKTADMQTRTCSSSVCHVHLTAWPWRSLNYPQLCFHSLHGFTYAVEGTLFMSVEICVSLHWVSQYSHILSQTSLGFRFASSFRFKLFFCSLRSDCNVLVLLLACWAVKSRTFCHRGPGAVCKHAWLYSSLTDTV